LRQIEGPEEPPGGRQDDSEKHPKEQKIQHVKKPGANDSTGLEKTLNFSYALQFGYESL
jgi:hypothetical protein